MILLLLGVALAADARLVPDALLGDPAAPALDAERTVFTEDARAGRGFMARADAWWTRDSALWISEDGETTRLLGHALALHSSLVGWLGPARLGVATPAWLHSGGQALGQVGPILGDARFDLKLALPLGDGVGVAPLARLYLPLGADAWLLGHSGPTWEAGLAADLSVGPALFALNVGTRGMPPGELYGLTVDDQLWYAAAGAVALGSGTLGLELLGHTQYDTFFGDVSTSPLELAITGTARLGPRTTLRGGLGTALVGGLGAPALRLAVGIGYAGEPTPGSGSS